MCDSALNYRNPKQTEISRLCVFFLAVLQDGAEGRKSFLHRQVQAFFMVLYVPDAITLCMTTVSFMHLNVTGHFDVGNLSLKCPYSL